MTGDALQREENAVVLDFLRHGLTTDEIEWPRFEPVLRTIAEVPLGALRVHPDLSDQLLKLAAPYGREDRRMLLAVAVLVAPTGVIYAVTYSQQFLAVRLPPEIAGAISPLMDAAPQPEARVRRLGEGWSVLNPWSADSSRAILAARAATTEQ